MHTKQLALWAAEALTSLANYLLDVAGRLRGL